MLPLVLDYLRTHSFRDLKNDHGVNARISSNRKKVSLNYDQIEVKSGDRLAEQCRGMIVTLSSGKQFCKDDLWMDAVGNELKLVAWPMSRFYNAGDNAAHAIAWDDPDLSVYEKLDGTMITFYHCDNEWHAATRSMPDADLPICEDHIEIGNMTFSGLFWIALRNAFVTNNSDLAAFSSWVDSTFDPKNTYVFELTSSFNRVVVKYDETRVTLLAIRDITTGLEKSIHNENLCVPLPKRWSLRSVDLVASFVNSIDATKLEGAVVCDSHFNRIKVKSMAWCFASRSKDTVIASRRNAFIVIVKGQLDDVLPLLSNDAAHKLIKLQSGLMYLTHMIDKEYQKMSHESDGSRKHFATLVFTSHLRNYSSLFFSFFDKKNDTATSWLIDLVNKDKLSDKTIDMFIEYIDSYF